MYIKLSYCTERNIQCTVEANQLVGRVQIEAGLELRL